jgi:hypothetical protein
MFLELMKNTSIASTFIGYLFAIFSQNTKYFDVEIIESLLVKYCTEVKYKDVVMTIQNILQNCNNKKIQNSNVFRKIIYDSFYEKEENFDKKLLNFCKISDISNILKDLDIKIKDDEEYYFRDEKDQYNSFTNFLLGKELKKKLEGK